jgi:hypothetical protein
LGFSSFVLLVYKAETLRGISATTRHAVELVMTATVLDEEAGGARRGDGFFRASRKIDV